LASALKKGPAPTVPKANWELGLTWFNWGGREGIEGTGEPAGQTTVESSSCNSGRYLLVHMGERNTMDMQILPSL